MAKFALLLNHAPDRYTGLNEDDYMAIIKDYVAWIEQASADGIYVSGHKLAPGPGKTVTVTNNGIEVHDSPFTELAEVLGGIMIVEATDYPAAVELARHHPHMVHNKTIEVRQIDGED
ncbi:MAG: YciI family protein [Oceanococcus sp.]